MYINETSAREYLHFVIDVLEGRNLRAVYSMIGAMIRQDDELAKRIGKKSRKWRDMKMRDVLHLMIDQLDGQPLRVAYRLIRALWRNTFLQHE